MLTELNTVNFSPSCERNKQVILEQLSPLLAEHSNILEIGSLSGQHAGHFAPALSHLTWQCSDIALHIAGLSHNLKQLDLANLPAPLSVDLAQSNSWPEQHYDAMYSANTLHIVAWSLVEKLFQLADASLRKQQSSLLIYGPFKYGGEYTSASNADFQLWLKDRDPLSGIRDFEAVNELAQRYGFTLEQDITMPANNQLLVWRR
ncbi:DUF938 domain-containing protein [Thalassotalea sp. HSM 43]|uniref:DUF938 domain-containing protein n=1 Tax=Thalassotalea sp. HSM 43 TaxID=2552945 RepID=UPI00108191CB|nr:DUF938 domain-containing protein [Thalassotalea sp. HSM 43]QBY04126.1 DUF938 domain-containing protein [Thalassotalea sp. HSM 43]